MIKRHIQGNRKTISAKPPAHLNKTAGKIWTATLKTVADSGFQIDQLDTEAFTAFCSAAATIRQCDKILDRDGLVVDGGRDGIKRHPAAATKNAALVQLRAYASALGLTASSRSKLPEEFQPEESNPFADLMDRV